ncbi:MAG: nucleotidyltransferase domain-containing protein, partial [Bacillota bacterium]
LSVSDDVPAEDIIAAFADSATIGLALTGSYARGEATPWSSDIGILRFIQVQPSDEEGLYSLSMLDGKLWSLNTTTIAVKEASSSRPQDAIWTVPALRQTRIILDRTGELGALKQKADDFRWEVLQDPADRHASYISMD